MRFYNGGMFSAAYRDTMFVAMNGSWNRTDKRGYNVMQVSLDAKRVRTLKPFLEGFLTDPKSDPPMWAGRCSTSAHNVRMKTAATSRSSPSGVRKGIAGSASASTRCWRACESSRESPPAIDPSLYRVEQRLGVRVAERRLVAGVVAAVVRCELRRARGRGDAAGAVGRLDQRVDVDLGHVG